MWNQLSQWIPGLDWTLVLVYLRVQACVLVLPGLGERVIPARVKVTVAMAISPLLATSLAGGTIPTQPVAMLAQIAGEVLIGAATGLMLRLLAFALDIATSAIAATASLSQIVGVQNESSPHPIGNLLHLGGLAVLMALGLPIMLVQLMADSFALWPPASWPDISRLMPATVSILSQSFVLAMMLAAPFTLGGFMFQALSGVINRVMPSLPVVFIGSPASIMLALGGLALLAPMLVGLWADAVLTFMLPR